MHSPTPALLTAVATLGSFFGYDVARADVASAARQQTAAVSTPTSSPRLIAGKPIKCDRGKIDIYPCNNVELLSFLPKAMVGANAEDDLLTAIWGWIDSTTKREFAVVGHTSGTSFVEVTDPVNPKYLGMLPYTEGAEPSKWRDMRVYKNYAYIISDNAGEHGMQVFDLTQLRDVKTPAVFRETAHYSRFGSGHTLASDEATGFLYIAGANNGGETCGGGLHMVNVREPTKPTFAGCYTEMRTGGRSGPGYVHESQCLVYQGPDADYRGHELCLNASADALGVADVTDKANPKTISIAGYPDPGYVHQGWFTMDQRYFIVNDELDEIMRKQRGETNIRNRTIVFDMKDLDDPVVAAIYNGPTGATDHNHYIRGRYLYQAGNASGLRIIDVNDPVHLKEVGFLDTYPESDDPGFIGSWGIYPYFANNVVAITRRDGGLFLARLQDAPGDAGAQGGPH